MLALAAVVVAFVSVRRRDRGEVLEPPPAAERPARGPVAPPRTPVDEAPPDQLTEPEVEVRDDLSGVLPPEVVVAGPELTEEEEAENVALAEEAEAAEEGDLLEPAVRPTFRERLTRARSTFSGYLGSILSRSGIDEETWEELEEAMIRADVGIGPTQALLDSVRLTARERGITTPEQLIEVVKEEMKARLAGPVELATGTRGRRSGSSSASTASARRPRSARSAGAWPTRATTSSWRPATRSGRPRPSSWRRGPSAAAHRSCAAARARTPRR